MVAKNGHPQMNMIALLRRRAEQLLHLASVTVDEQDRVVLLEFADAMIKEAHRLEKAESQSKI